ncbi:MAG TPA: excinuclease ABC subunit UvrA [Candidatus Moranbacteria bacterium]|nr:excinuclease ABC subunit UvrA [Candidatus Moranbacteria bacterium]
MKKQDEQIEIYGARQNNLKNINVQIPKNKLVVITGVSGSGKSSLAFDTLYAEGYRRYVENLSSTIQGFFQSAKKPLVDRIDNLTPAIAVDQIVDASNPRSTVGTLSGSYGILRVLFAQFGVPHCPKCGIPMHCQDEKETINLLKRLQKGTQVLILAKWKGKQKKNAEKLTAIANQGYGKVVIEKKMYVIGEIDEKLRGLENEVWVVVDRFTFLASEFDEERVIDSLQVAAQLAGGVADIMLDGEMKSRFAKKLICKQCGHSFKKITTKNFSFNSPEGACETCGGIGLVFQGDFNKIIPSKKISLNEGAIMPWSQGKGSGNIFSRQIQILEALARYYKISLNKPVRELPKKILEKIIFGEKNGIELEIFDRNKNKKKIIFKGVASELSEKYESNQPSFVKTEIEKYLTKQTCSVCQGKRLKRDFLHVQFLGKTIDKIVSLEIGELVHFVENSLELGDKVNKKDKKTVHLLLQEFLEKLQPLAEIGLDYLNLDRSVQTLSGGEFQRLRLGGQLLSGLAGVIYVLDEPSIGLHPRDTNKLIKILRQLQEKGNTVVVVEHDPDIIKKADWLIDIGPKAGKDGGKVVFSGPISKLKEVKTETSQYLFERRGIKKEKLKKGKRDFLEIKNARENNLKNIDVKIPLYQLVSVTGVSGGGKSSLINDVLAQGLRKKIHRAQDEVGKHDKIIGSEKLAKVVVVDQSPIGRNSRSNTATYTGVFSHIRELFSKTELAQKNRLTAGHFSFNIKGGRCEYCHGEGMQMIEMYLLKDVFIPCSYCGGSRYNKKILPIEYHGANIVEVLNMSVEYASHFFSSHQVISRRLEMLKKVGLGYLRLGQSATELSGGEAQRIKLAKELGRKTNGKTIYILDEPTIGLHFSDIEKLMKVLHQLVSAGNSVVVIEHNEGVICASDYVIELGPEGGRKGGKVVFQGTPTELRKASTWTGKMLRAK